MSADAPNFSMPITTPRLLIRPPELGDEVIVNQAILDSFDMLHEFMAWAKEKPTLEETKIHVRDSVVNWILKKNNEPYLPLFLFDKSSGAFVGAAGFHHYDWEVPCIETG